MCIVSTWANKTPTVQQLSQIFNINYKITQTIFRARQRLQKKKIITKNNKCKTKKYKIVKSTQTIYY